MMQLPSHPSLRFGPSCTEPGLSPQPGHPCPCRGLSPSLSQWSVSLPGAGTNPLRSSQRLADLCSQAPACISLLGGACSGRAG